MTNPPEAEAVAWITGANGLIGHALWQQSHSQNLPWRIEAITRAHFDLCETRSIRQAVKRSKPSLIIHCAAMSSNPTCSENPNLAHEVNVRATRELADAAEDARLLFFSTDLVFNGQKGNYRETDSPQPLSVYAETKLLSEELLAKRPNTVIIRTSINGGPSPSKKRGFDEALIQQWRSKITSRLFRDEYRSPLFASTTASVVWRLAQSSEEGIFHIAGPDRLSRLDIGRRLAACYPELSPAIEATSLNDYDGAPRSPDTSLSIEKVESRLGLSIPSFEESLQQNHPMAAL